MNKKSKLIFSIIFLIFVAVLGSIFVYVGIDWFNGLIKPSQWVNNIIIPIVWTVIYTLFGVYIVNKTKNDDMSKTEYLLLMINGIFNVLWCLFFFTLHQLLGGLIFILVNAIFAFWLLNLIMKKDKFWGVILYVYSIWLCIASCLNIACWILN